MGICEKEYADHFKGVYDVQTAQMFYMAGGSANGCRAEHRCAIFIFCGNWKCEWSCAVADTGMHSDYYRIFDPDAWAVSGRDSGEQKAATGYPISCAANGI